jgi:DNA repair exonuclease SbcCD ATPase subunit
VAQVRFNISLPDSLKAQLQTDAEKQGVAASKLITTYIAEHYATTEALERFGSLEQECITMQEQLTQERNQAAQLAEEQAAVAKELQNELQNEKTRMKTLAQGVVDKDDKIQLFEQDLTKAQEMIQQLEQSTQELQAKLKAESETYQQAITERERHHKDVLNEEERRHTDIANALRHEQELTQSKLEARQRELQREQEINRELRTDKEQLQKQLELVTLRLPAPKGSFWSRVFGRKKEANE